ncbi:MAG: hypothetical protein ACD_39C00442G0001 [uncultured bacterium]|nr:MAG: hypothetical protein ACD_39C00442G0001 [uncultured bacterium]
MVGKFDGSALFILLIAGISGFRQVWVRYLLEKFSYCLAVLGIIIKLFG